MKGNIREKGERSDGKEKGKKGRRGTGTDE